MPQQEITGTKISAFPAAAASDINPSDVVAGVGDGINKKFSFAAMLAWIKARIDPADIGAVPSSRTVNGKALSSDITLSASDVSAIPTSEKGANGGVATLGNDGKVPSAQLPAIDSTAADVTYDNTQSGLTADDVQEAIDELAAGAGGSTAATTSYDNTDSGLAATNAQDAIDELADEKADQTTVAPVEASTTASEAHPLGSIFYLSGVLYRALSDIAIGGTINTGTGGNATQTTVAQNFKRTVTLTAAQYAQLSAAEKAADIVYIVTDEPVPAISTATPNMDGVGSAGSTGEVSDAGHTHPSDTTKANQDQLAYVETGPNSSKAYAVGEYFCWNGLLYRATSAISSGAAFTVGTNCEQTYAAVPSCRLVSVTFNCNSSGQHTFSNGELPNRALSSPVGCLAKDSSNNYLNAGTFDINPRYTTAGTFISSSCANKEVTLFFAVYNLYN